MQKRFPPIFEDQPSGARPTVAGGTPKPISSQCQTVERSIRARPGRSSWGFASKLTKMTM